MRIWKVALWTVIATSLPAQEGAPGFSWIGLRAGSTSFDPKENVKAATFVGGQGGMLFDQQRYGLSLEVFSSQPASNLPPYKKLTHNQYSLSLLSGLMGESSGAFWPYAGLGLGGSSVAKVNPATGVPETTMATSAHASFGILHRPFQHVIWGVDARYLVIFSNPGMNAFQGSAMLGFTWGGAKASRPADRRPASVAPPAPVQAPAPAPVPAPPAPLPVVETVPPPPAPKPLPVVTAPRPMAAEPAPVPATTAPAPAPTTPAPAPTTPAPALAAPPKVAPAPVKPPAPVPAPVRSTPDANLTERLDALLLGDLAKAVDLGRKRIESMPARRWTLRLEIANLPATLKNAVVAFPGRKPDLFVAPIKLRGGKTAYQLFLGDYASKAEAEQAARAVPAVFLEGGSRPKPFLVGEIPSQVGR